MAERDSGNIVMHSEGTKLTFTPETDRQLIPVTVRIIPPYRERSLIEFTCNVPYIPFPESPQERKRMLAILDGKPVYKLISPQEMQALLQAQAQIINAALHHIDAAYVNLNGGFYLRDILTANIGKRFDEKLNNGGEIEYHRTDGGGGSVTVKKPANIGETNLVVESCIDSGGVAQAILDDLTPETIFAISILKFGVKGQKLPPNFIPAVIIDNVWYGGNGADFGQYANSRYGYEEDFPRNYGGIVIMPESLATATS